MSKKLSQRLGRNPLQKKVEVVTPTETRLFKEVVKPQTSMSKIKEMQLEINWAELTNHVVRNGLSRVMMFKKFLVLTLILCAGCMPRAQIAQEDSSIKKQLIEMQKNQARVSSQIEDLNNKILLLNDKLENNGKPAVTSSEKNYSPNMSGDLKLYEMALLDLKNKSFDPFKKKVELLVKGYKESPLTNNALFLLGETYFKNSDFKNASLTFEKLYSMSPDGNRAVQSLHMLGLSYERMGRKQEAREAYQSVMSIYPGSKEALDASKKFARLSKEKNH